jgi:hypothetical protein
MYGLGEYGLGYKYWDGENLFGLSFYPKLENPDIVSCFIVRPTGPKVIEKVLNLASFVQENKKTPVYIKKIFREQYDELLSAGFKNTETNPWHSTAPSEDDSHPERIVDVKFTLNYARKLGRTRQLNRSLRNYEKIQDAEKYRFKSAFDNEEEAKALIKVFFNQREYLISRPEDYHNIIRQKIPEIQYCESLIYQDVQPIGMYLCEVQNSEYASLYATITDRQANNYLTDFIMFKLMNDLEDLGIKYLNLGGSEFRSLDEFKLKFKPVISQQMYWATLF